MIEKLLKLLKISFSGEVPLKDGTMIRVSGDVVVGASVFVQSPDGEIPMPDGDYELETGEIMTTKGGKIEAISSPVDTTQAPDVSGMGPVGEITAPENMAIGDNLPPVADTGKPVIPETPKTDTPGTPDPEVEKLKGKLDELTKRLDDLESKLNVKAEIETEMRSELDFIKTKTLVTELKKSKDVEDKTISRFDVIKNLKNKQKEYGI